MNIILLNSLRLTHVVAGILWAGAAITYLFFIKSSVQAIGAAGPQFMQAMMSRRKYPIFMSVSSFLTILAGLALFWYASGGLSVWWLRSGPGVGFTIGSIAAVIAFLLGMLGIGPTSGRIAALGQEMAASGKAPTPEQMNRMRQLEQRVSRLERVEFILLVVALVTMATARYWAF